MSYSIETLHHFRCSACKAWWSVADKYPTEEIVIELLCPFCSAEECHQREVPK